MNVCNVFCALYICFQIPPYRNDLYTTASKSLDVFVIVISTIVYSGLCESPDATKTTSLMLPNKKKATPPSYLANRSHLYSV